MAVLLFIATSCGEDAPEKPSETDTTQKLLLGTWNLAEVLVDGSSTDVYAGLSLTFTNTTITSAKSGPLWPATTTWKFVDDTAKSIERSDGLVIDIISVSEAQLKLGLVWTQTTVGGRLSSIAGKHVFTFSR